MERLHALDAEFLHIEDRSSPMHIACVCIFEGPAPGADQLRELFEAKLQLVPRYRQRVRTLPLELGRPVWVDMRKFDLGYHLRRTALPAPGDDASLCALIGRLMEQRLDRDKPLWECWVVEGLEGERWAAILKVHHCMVDGVSGIDLLNVLLERAPDAPLPEPRAWEPTPEPKGAALVMDAWRGLARDAGSWLVRIQQQLQHPSDALRTMAVTAEGLLAFFRGDSLPALSISGPIGSHRLFAHASVKLSDVRKVREQFGGTVNDVVMTALTWGYRSFLLHRGDPLDKAVVRTLVPVSMRTADAKSIRGNRVSALLFDLPVHLTEPRQILETVKEGMQRLKASNMAEAGEWFTAITDLAPPMVVGSVSRVVARLMHQLPQTAFNAVTTNVPGPPVPLFCLGRRMLEAFPYVPISQGLRLGTAILSYDGKLSFGVTADRDNVPDVSVLARAIEDGMARLVALTREATTGAAQAR